MREDTSMLKGVIRQLHST